MSFLQRDVSKGLLKHMVQLLDKRVFYCLLSIKLSDTPDMFYCNQRKETYAIFDLFSLRCFSKDYSDSGSWADIMCCISFIHNQRSGRLEWKIKFN